MIYNRQLPQINESIRKTKRAILGLGCSFVQGFGALDSSIYETYKWKMNPPGGSVIRWVLNQAEQQQLVADFPDISISDASSSAINFSMHENARAFTNVLATKYFEGKYTPLNFGRSGFGNRAAIKDLHFYPAINWDELEELIVIYAPTAPERLDLISDVSHAINQPHRWTCVWPNPSAVSRKELSTGYKHTISSSKFETLEQLVHVQDLLTWCKLKKAKLIIVPAFSELYTRDQFIASLLTDFKRDAGGHIVDIKYNPNNMESAIATTDLWPWENMFYPSNHTNWASSIIAHENPLDKTYFFNYLGVGSPGKWITPCAHPSAKAHDLLAQQLFEHIRGLQ